MMKQRRVLARQKGGCFCVVQLCRRLDQRRLGVRRRIGERGARLSLRMVGQDAASRFVQLRQTRLCEDGTSDIAGVIARERVDGMDQVRARDDLGFVGQRRLLELLDERRDQRIAIADRRATDGRHCAERTQLSAPKRAQQRFVSLALVQRPDVACDPRADGGELGLGQQLAHEIRDEGHVSLAAEPPIRQRMRQRLAQQPELDQALLGGHRIERRQRLSKRLQHRDQRHDVQRVRHEVVLPRKLVGHRFAGDVVKTEHHALGSTARRRRDRLRLGARELSVPKAQLPHQPRLLTRLGRAELAQQRLGLPMTHPAVGMPRHRGFTAQMLFSCSCATSNVRRSCTDRAARRNRRRRSSHLRPTTSRRDRCRPRRLRHRAPVRR